VILLSSFESVPEFSSVGVELLNIADVGVVDSLGNNRTDSKVVLFKGDFQTSKCERS
jgi:hypothetical protein